MSGNVTEVGKEVTAPPFEISQEEYNDLLSQIRNLAREELEEELILAARYGDKDVVYAILDNTNTDRSCYDTASGNTPLHMAAANGHLDIVDKLLQANAQHIKNQAGNTPLHWAAANGHDQVVNLLLQKVKGIDVLSKNQFGRSALTEGFSSQKTEVVKHLLEHDSATEEKLLQGTKQEEIDEEQEAEEFKKDSTKTDRSEGILHEFDFSIARSEAKQQYNDGLKIRELPIPATEDPFGKSPEKDTTGYGIWAASLVMARWMTSISERFRGKTVLELGAGCGVPGLATAFYSEAKQVYVTDLNPRTVSNLHFNIDLNQNKVSPSGVAWKDRVRAMPINWEDPKTWPDEKIDYVIGSDLIYQSSIVPMLKQVVLGLCRGHGSFMYVAPGTESDIGRDGLAEFIEEMGKTAGCEVVSEALAPKEYHANPLSSQDDEECFLHFHELSSASYRLYEFKINVV